MRHRFLRACNVGEAAAIGAPRLGVEMIPGSSAVERSTVNRMVACSNQARGAISSTRKSTLSRLAALRCRCAMPAQRSYPLLGGEVRLMRVSIALRMRPACSPRLSGKAAGSGRQNELDVGQFGHAGAPSCGSGSRQPMWQSARSGLAMCSQTKFKAMPKEYLPSEIPSIVPEFETSEFTGGIHEHREPIRSKAWSARQDRSCSSS